MSEINNIRYLEPFILNLARAFVSAYENGPSKSNSQYWWISSESAFDLNILPKEFEVGEISDQISILKTLDEGAGIDQTHLEALADMLRFLALDFSDGTGRRQEP